MCVLLLFWIGKYLAPSLSECRWLADYKAVFPDWLLVGADRATQSVSGESEFRFVISVQHNVWILPVRHSSRPVSQVQDSRGPDRALLHLLPLPLALLLCGGRPWDPDRTVREADENVVGGHHVSAIQNRPEIKPVRHSNDWTTQSMSHVSWSDFSWQTNNYSCSRERPRAGHHWSRRLLPSVPRTTTFSTSPSGRSTTPASSGSLRSPATLSRVRRSLSTITVTVDPGPPWRRTLWREAAACQETRNWSWRWTSLLRWRKSLTNPWRSSTIFSPKMVWVRRSSTSAEISGGGGRTRWCTSLWCEYWAPL